MKQQVDDGNAVVNIRIIDWSAAETLVMPVRETVFVLEQNVPIEIERDEHDATSRHAIAVASDGLVVGTGRLLPDGHIGRMAVLSAWRGQGVGGLLLTALIDQARQCGMVETVLNAQLAALAFYARFGFAAEGEVFMEAGIPHRVMRLTISGHNKHQGDSQISS